MKSYLNREEKEDALTLSLFINVLKDMTDKHVKLKHDKDMIKSLRMARSFIYRVLEKMFKGLDPLELAGICKQVDKMEVVPCYTTEAKRRREEAMKIEGVQTVATDELWEICEQALGVCKTCTKSPDGCRLKELFIGLGVPVFNESPGPGECPYCVEEVRV